MIGKPDTAKGTLINAFVFLCLTHKKSDWPNNELPYPVRITLGLTAMSSGIGFVQSLLQRQNGRIVHEVYRVIELGTDHGDIPTLEK